MQWYYCPDTETETVSLPDTESHHLTHVVRAKSGDEIILTNGKGTVATAELTKVSARECLAEIRSKRQEDYPVEVLNLAISPTKNIDRIEWLLEKATEMGVQQFSLLRCRYSERKDVNMERLIRIVTAASKQSQRSWFPEIFPMLPVSEFINNIKEPAFIAHCNPDFGRTGWSSYLAQAGKRTVLIGPEGDFSVEEIEYAYTKGLSGLDLGMRRLRTETAGLAVCLPLLIHDKSKTR